MSYCVNPECEHPENPESINFCESCGSGLLLNQRFRPVSLVGTGGFGKTYRAIDEHSIQRSYCLVKQFYARERGSRSSHPINLDSGETLNTKNLDVRSPNDSYKTEVEQLSNLKHPQIPSLITYFEQDEYHYIV